MSGKRGLRVGAANVVALLAVVGLAEGFLRLTGNPGVVTPAEADFAAFSLGYLQSCARVEVSDEGRRLVADHSGVPSALEAVSFAYPFEKPAGSLRLGLVGESSAANIGQAMRTVIEATSPDSVQLLHCALAGSALEHVQQRVAELWEYDLDALVVVFGNNLTFRYPMNPTAARLLLLGRYSALAAALGRRWAGTQMRNEPPETRLADYGRWLDTLAREATDRGVRLVVATLPINHFVPVHYSLEAFNDPGYLDARLQYASGDSVGAIARLEKILRDDREGLWHYTAGIWQWRRSNLAAAARHLTRAVDLDSVPGSAGRDRVSSVVADVVRAAAVRSGFALHDTARRVARDTSGLTGWDAMEDHCHLQMSRTPAEAAGILHAAGFATTLASDAAPSSAELAWQALRLADNVPTGRSLSDVMGAIAEYFLAAEPSAAENAIDRLRRELEGRGVRHRAQAYIGLAKAYWHTGSRDRAVELNEVAEQAGDPAAWVQRGLFELGRGDRRSALAAMRRALEIEPGRDDAEHFAMRLAAGE